MKLLLVAHDPDGVFQASVQDGVREVLSGRGHELTVIDGGQDLSGLDASAGLIVLANVLPEEQLLALRQAGVTLTLVSHLISAADIPTVMHENYQGMRQLFDYLFDERGCREPLLLGGVHGQLDAEERAAAFREGLLRRGLDPARHRTVQGEFDPELSAIRLEEHLLNGESFDSVIAADYLMGLSALPVLERHGRGELPVVGFGDGPEAEAAGLTTVAADVVELGRRAARQLLGQLPGADPGHPVGGRTLLSTHLIRRG